ncbi:MAG TPA: c-type cytochrome domain-containing protein [Kofleriaceae bacterium]
MKRLALLVTVTFAGCGTSPDERPVTFEYVSLGILAPTCGQVQCHSSTTKEEGYAFDTLAGAREALIDLAGGPNDPPVAEGTQLIEVITTSGGDRMPPDSPLADEDVDLIRNWINDGRRGL